MGKLTAALAFAFMACAGPKTIAQQPRLTDYRTLSQPVQPQPSAETPKPVDPPPPEPPEAPKEDPPPLRASPPPERTLLKLPRETPPAPQTPPFPDRVAGFQFGSNRDQVLQLCRRYGEMYYPTEEPSRAWCTAAPVPIPWAKEVVHFQFSANILVEISLVARRNAYMWGLKRKYGRPLFFTDQPVNKVITEADRWSAAMWRTDGGRVWVLRANKSRKNDLVVYESSLQDSLYQQNF